MLLLGVTTPPHPAPRTAPFSAATLKGFGRWLTVFLPPGPAPSRTLGWVPATLQSSLMPQVTVKQGAYKVALLARGLPSRGNSEQ